MHHPHVVVLACAVLTACGGPPSLTGEEAGRVFWSVEKLLESGYREATASLMPIDFTQACPTGGELHFVGEGVKDAMHVEFTGEFDACGFNDLTLSGVIDYLQVGTTVDGVSEKSIRHTGELTVDGEVVGSCALDREWIINMNAPALKGSVCGHAADTLPTEGLPP